jgi:hypothetical protein
MQALVRVQARLLARIVVEIRAADIAVELELCSGAVRASSQSRAALLTRPPTCLQDKRDEVVLVGELRRFDRGVGLRRQSRCGTTVRT